MLTYKSLKWLLDNGDTLEGSTAVRNFVLLVAQNNPEVFEETLECINTGKFGPRPPIELRFGADVPDAKTHTYLFGNTPVTLTEAQVTRLIAEKAVNGEDSAVELLCKFAPGLPNGAAVCIIKYIN